MEQLTRLLIAGAQLLIARQPRVQRLNLSGNWLFGMALVSLAVKFGFDFAVAQPPRLFDLNGLQSWALLLLTSLLTGMLAARWCRQPALLWQLPVLIISADLLRDLLMLPAYAWLSWNLDSHWSLYLWVWYASIVWLGIPVYAALRALQPWQYRYRQILPAIAYPAVVYLLATNLTLAGLWQTDYSEYYPGASADTPSFNTERLLYRQTALVEQRLTELAPQRPEITDMYFLHVAGHGEQDVFMLETQYAEQLFTERFDAADRQLMLINNPATVKETPLATASNLQTALNGLSEIMDTDEDILFLFLTSHGAENHWLSFSLYNVPLNNLSADYLASLLSQSGIQSKVVVVSACYSGGFIEPLQDEHSLVITASRADRRSFGCTDDAELTYFGRAFFESGLQQSNSFIEAFEIARGQVAEWENENGFEPSLPQIHNPSAILRHLDSWRESITALRNSQQ